MMNGKRKIAALAALCMAGMIASSMTGCSLNITVNDSSSTPDISVADDTSAEENSEDETSDESSAGDESSAQISEEESKPGEKPDKPSEESAQEQSMTESEAAEVVIDGYQFDDEQIVTDYHTAEEFTKNEEFNKIFKDNVIDTEYTDNLREAMTLTEMRQATIACAEMWEEEVGQVYGILCDMLKDNPEELKKLQDSQAEWESGVSVAESSFSAEASGGGSEAMLSADTAMMNYFKGRAAVLLEQIYELNGDQILLVEYGL